MTSHLKTVTDAYRFYGTIERRCVHAYVHNNTQNRISRSRLGPSRSNATPTYIIDQLLKKLQVVVTWSVLQTGVITNQLNVHNIHWLRGVRQQEINYQQFTKFIKIFSKKLSENNFLDNVLLIWTQKLGANYLLQFRTESVRMSSPRTRPSYMRTATTKNVWHIFSAHILTTEYFSTFSIQFFWPIQIQFWAYTEDLASENYIIFNPGSVFLFVFFCLQSSIQNVQFCFYYNF